MQETINPSKKLEKVYLIEVTKDSQVVLYDTAYNQGMAILRAQKYARTHENSSVQITLYEKQFKAIDVINWN